MDIYYFTRQLADNGVRIAALVRGVTAAEAAWRPDPASWSILEVINHLLDEEREDFRVRLDIILHRPEEPWAPIDPAGWVKERRYNERELESSIQAFLDERSASLSWLRGLEAPDWEASVQAPFGRMRAGDMFVSWASHDQLHMRQLVELHRAYSVFKAGTYQLRYAGEW
jgi:hypothetical protein